MSKKIAQQDQDEVQAVNSDTDFDSDTGQEESSGWTPDLDRDMTDEEWAIAEKKFHKKPRKSNKKGKALCKGLTVWGTPCQMFGNPDNGGYCRFHDPTGICEFRDGANKCRRTAIAGSQFCRHHLSMIGKISTELSPTKVKLPSFLKYLPSALANRAAEMDKDPDLTNIRHDIVLLSTRLTHLLEGLKDPTLEYYEMLVVFDGLSDAYHSDDDQGVQLGLERLRQHLMEGVSQKQAWEEVYNIIERRQKSIMLERKQIMDDGGMIPVQQVIALMTRLLSVVSVHVKEPQLLMEIKKEFDRAVMLREHGGLIEGDLSSEY